MTEARESDLRKLLTGTLPGVKRTRLIIEGPRGMAISEGEAVMGRKKGKKKKKSLSKPASKRMTKQMRGKMRKSGGY